VVIIDSALRLAFINPQEVYPEIFKPLVDPMYQVQRDFVHGLCSFEEMSPGDIVRLLLIHRRKRDRKNILQVKKILSTSSPKVLANDLILKGRIDESKIAIAAGDQADSAAEAVDYFSGNYQESLTSLARAWSPKGERARTWQMGMIEYLDGIWLKKTKDHLGLL